MKHIILISISALFLINPVLSYAKLVYLKTDLTVKVKNNTEVRIYKERKIKSKLIQTRSTIVFDSEGEIIEIKPPIEESGG